MGLENLQKHVSNDLTVFRQDILPGLTKFRYRGKNVLLGHIEEDRYKASFEQLKDYRFGGIVGGAQPSDYSASVLLWNEYFKAKKLKAIFYGFDVQQNEEKGRISKDQPKFSEFLKTALDEHELYELTVTDPYKKAAFDYMASLKAQIQPNALDIGVINHIIKAGDLYVCLNTDGLGMIKALQEKKDISKSKVLVLGAGGSSTAITYELMAAGVRELVILNRTEEKAIELGEKWSGLFGKKVIADGLSSLDKHLDSDIIIQAVTEGNVLDKVLAEKTKKDSLFVDTRYGKKAVFGEVAGAAGRSFIDGKGMLYWQFVIALQYVEQIVFNGSSDKHALEASRSAFGY